MGMRLRPSSLRGYHATVFGDWGASPADGPSVRGAGLRPSGIPLPKYLPVHYRVTSFPSACYPFPLSASPSSLRCRLPLRRGSCRATRWSSWRCRHWVRGGRVLCACTTCYVQAGDGANQADAAGHWVGAAMDVEGGVCSLCSPRSLNTPTPTRLSIPFGILSASTPGPLAGTFEFGGIQLLEFMRDHILAYTEDPDKEIRQAAVLAACRVLERHAAGAQAAGAGGARGAHGTGGSGVGNGGSERT